MLEMIKVDPESGMQILKILGVKSVCCSCGKSITKENFGGIFGTHLVCNNEVCISTVI